MHTITQAIWIINQLIANYGAPLCTDLVLSWLFEKAAMLETLCNDSHLREDCEVSIIPKVERDISLCPFWGWFALWLFNYIYINIILYNIYIY